ncbi:putative mitochondrial large ribosomal subunit [Diaporthe ampelina]|uniref:Putative mitochondrial large ribosomal subunit n=1 Tax=Diaporthe ampelina TaxID=1214573 RepID=A0A0G2H759_9PEZI|nr:putative mitochondrial large ribosomal subunit [Diaporthe ampelina]
MSLHLPSRRVLGTTPTILKTLRPTLSPSPSASTSSLVCRLLKQQHQHQLQQTRNAATKPNKRNLLRGYNKPKDLHKPGGAIGDLTSADGRRGIEDRMRERMTSIRLESDSIFDDELKASGDDAGAQRGPVDAEGKGKNVSGSRESVMGASLLRDHMRHAIDPDPQSRMRWERRMVARQVARRLDARGRETRDERIRRTEREATSRSAWLATSTKKLVHLAHQISGKTLEEARTQMKFSKKKFAREVLYELELARDKAIVERGMGLGKATGEFVPGITEKRTVKDFRHGKFVEIDDPSRIYVSEAWVNRGPWRGKKPNYRARGRVDLIQMPQASITIRLKEENTRIREFEEKKARQYKQGPWVHLPNRPVTAQRPFYSW